MAMIPMKDTVTITQAGTLDEWGQPTAGEAVTYKCRIDEGTRLTRDQNGKEVVANTRILLNGSVGVGYDDDVTFTDFSGVERTARPIRINAKKGVTKVLFTEVEL